MKINNILVQIISLALWAFALAGLKIDPNAVAEQGYTAITTSNWSLFTIVILNLGNSIWEWSKTWKTAKPNFWAFAKSPNFLASALNIVFAFLAMQGVVLPADAATKLIEFAFNGQWWQMLGYALPNVIAPIVKWISNQKTKV